VSTVASYPVSRPAGNAAIVVEPLVGLRFAPRLSNNSDVPNEDSRDLELDITNLFKPNRFPGADRIEDGSRVTYGVRSGLYWPTGGYASLFLGQSYRFLDASNLPKGSGLSNELSDIVGQFQASPGRYIDLDYRFRFGSRGEFNQKHELTVAAGVPQLTVSANYLYLNGGEGTGLRDRNQLTLAVTSQITQNWTVGGVTQNNIGYNAGLITGGLLLSYHDECFIFGVSATRDLTSQPGAEPNTAVIFTIGLKNLGTVASPISTNSLTQSSRRQR
jgi:LPS-assembly protein